MYRYLSTIVYIHHIYVPTAEHTWMSKSNREAAKSSNCMSFDDLMLDILAHWMEPIGVYKSNLEVEHLSLSVSNWKQRNRWNTVSTHRKRSTTPQPWEQQMSLRSDAHESSWYHVFSMDICLVVEPPLCKNMGVSWNRGTPSSHPFQWDFPL